jgi:hypothetical protein
VLALLLSPSAAFASGPPSIEEESVSGITPTNAILEARINPHGSSIAYQFQLVADPSEYLPEFACPTDEFPAGSSLCILLPEVEGALPIGGISGETKTVSLNLETDLDKPEEHTLQPDTTYHYRVIGARRIFTEDTIELEEPTIFGPDQTFTTPGTTVPLINSESVSGITPTNAILKANITPPSGNGAYYQFQLVTDPEEYASEILCPIPPEPGPLCIGPAAEGALPIEYVFGGATQVSLDLSGKAGVILQPGTTYHYRVLAARSIFGEDTIQWESPIVYGVDHTFTTPKEEGGEEGGGSTNRRTLTLTKSANGPGGLGSVSSKPKGIRCGLICSSAVASMYENSSVELTARPGTRSAFSEWKGGDCEGSHSLTCTVTMDTAESIEAVFAPLPAQSEKTISPAEALTLGKEGSGLGTVKAIGLACEAQCTETVVLYQGPNPPKAAATVTLTAIPAFGSEFTGWSGSGCAGTGSCVVTMSAAKSVTATFTAKPNGTLLIEKALNTGTVTSKPKGIKCATACISQSASMPQGESIVLTAMAVTGMTFSKWEGGDCQGIVLPTCTVVMDSSEPIKALFTGTPKAVSPQEALTLTKAGSGLGTVKGSGLACEALCTSVASVYKGPTKTVTLEAASAPGTKPVQWSSCDSVTEGKCVVTMTGLKAVTATFEELGGEVVEIAKALSEVAVLDDFGYYGPPTKGKWTKTAWAKEIGFSWTGSWHGYGTFGGHPAGAYWNPAYFNDAHGVLVAATVGTGSSAAGEYGALWLDMPDPQDTRSGYEARISGTNGSSSGYKVEISKWVSGTRTVLASEENVSVPVGTTLALTKSGGALTLWSGAGSFSQVVSATDTSYHSGYAGIEVNGGEGTYYNFQAGAVNLGP